MLHWIPLEETLLSSAADEVFSPAARGKEELKMGEMKVHITTYYIF